jgi:hypothetical protein
MLTVAARYNGLVQPPGARMILIRLRGTNSCSGRPSRSTTYGLTSKSTPALRAALAFAIRQMRPSTRCTVTPDSPNNNVVPLLKPVAS